MWFVLARKLAMGNLFAAFKNQHADECGGSRGTNRRRGLRATVNQHDDSEGVPNPAIAHAGSGDHPKADPTRWTPAIHATHQAMVACFNEAPDRARDGHGGYLS